MSSDLIALIVAVALGAATVGLGWRRRLGGETSDWLPEFEGRRAHGEPAPPPSGFSRRPSPGEMRWIPRLYLLLGLCFVAGAILSPHGGLSGALLAGVWIVNAFVYWLRWSRTAVAGKSHQVQ